MIEYENYYTSNNNKNTHFSSKGMNSYFNNEESNSNDDEDDYIIRGSCSLNNKGNNKNNIEEIKDNEYKQFSFRELINKYFGFQNERNKIKQQCNSFNKQAQIYDSYNFNIKDNNNPQSFSHHHPHSTNSLNSLSDIKNNKCININDYKAKILTQEVKYNSSTKKKTTKGKFLIAHKDEIDSYSYNINKEKIKVELNLKRTLIVIFLLIIFFIAIYDSYCIYSKLSINQTIEINHCYSLYQQNHCNNISSNAPEALKKECFRLNKCLVTNRISIINMFSYIIHRLKDRVLYWLGVNWLFSYENNNNINNSGDSYYESNSKEDDYFIYNEDEFNQKFNNNDGYVYYVNILYWLFSFDIINGIKNFVFIGLVMYICYKILKK